MKTSRKLPGNCKRPCSSWNRARIKGRRKTTPARNRKAEKAEAEQQKQPEQQAAAEETGQQNEEASPVSEAPAGVSPEDIINEELENRKYRSVRGTTGYKPVDKDW